MFPMIYIEEAYNGKQGIEKVEEKKVFDLILMDVNMPVMDGKEATRILKEKMKINKLPYSPIITFTAYCSFSEKQ